MSKMLGAAVAAVVLSCAGAASAATHVLTFENYNVGDVINGYVAGTPYPVMHVQGEIVAGPTGNALKLTPRGGYEDASFLLRTRFTGNYVVPETKEGKILYQPALTKFDYFAPEPGTLDFTWMWAPITHNLTGGGWKTLAPNYFVDTTSWRAYTSVPYLLLDNITFAEAYGVVPEPATWAMLILGFGAAGVALRRSRHTAFQQRYGVGS